ncbi:MAG: guanylate kinase [Coriobacteriales bacterium]|nr:guanylate kinase [Coriobacteriales bacterium]
MPGNLFVVSGPSGAGKGTLLARVLQELEGIWLSISATTRTPRRGEQNGKDYFFLSVEEFQRLIATDGLLEWAVVHGNYYGTKLSVVTERLDAGIDVVLEIDPQGAFQIAEKIPTTVLVFIAPPSLAILEQRLRLRGTEDEEALALRLANARLELAQRERYTVTIVNDDLATAAMELRTVFESYRRTEK